MSDPQRPIKTPVGSRFMLEWTTDRYVNLVNRFVLVDGSTRDYPGQAPAKPPSIFKKIVDLTATLTVTVDKDDVPDGFRMDVPTPETFETKKYGAVERHGYRSYFLARVEGVYTFTVKFDHAEAPAFTKVVEVVAAPPLNQRRKDLLAVIDRWLPDVVPDPRKLPDGETRSILEQAGWSLTPGTRTLDFSIPPANLPNMDDAPILPLPQPDVWTQMGSLVLARTQGWLEKAKAVFNAEVLPRRQAAWEALPKPRSQPAPLALAINTSCGDVAGRLISMWSNGKSRVQIADRRKHPAYKLASEMYARKPPVEPQPGDVIFLDNSKRWFAHMCILISRSDDLWVTADGGGGSLPGQTAGISHKPISWTAPDPNGVQVPMIASVTDNKIKIVDGWIDLDEIPNDRYDASGNLK